MKRLLRPFCAAGLFLLVGLCQPSAAGPRDELVVSAAWLAQHREDPGLVLLHVGDRKEYDTTHIPGARFVSLQDLSVSDTSGKGLTLEMLPAEELRTRLESFGISDASRIIVYHGTGPITRATRIIFTLDYAGLGSRTSLLDGGLAGWTRAGHPVTDVVPPSAKGTLSAFTLRPIVVDAARVRASLNKPGVVVVDARASTFYDGTQTGGSKDNPHKTGHIAGASSVPFSTITDDQTRLRPAAELEAALAKAGVKPGDTVIVYCHIGQQATAVVFGARTLGHPVLLYDGSFEDWSRQAGFPVENPAEKRPE